MTKTIEQLTAAKTGKVLQELRNLILNFEQNGFDMGPGGKAFLEFMDGQDLQERQRIAKARKMSEKFQREQEEYLKKTKKCPKCTTPMYCYPVNTGPRDQVGNNWKSQWICGNTDCLHEEFSLNSVEREMEILGLANRKEGKDTATRR